MVLRQLEAADASFMLDWMHDPFVVQNLRTNFKDKTIADCEAFIKAAKDNSNNLHLAIADETNIYQGTVSLKHIDSHAGCAEFAITIRRCAMGKGISKAAMFQILTNGIQNLGLQTIYWCVDPTNVRAVRFYDKNGFRRIPVPEYPAVIAEYTAEQISGFYWYAWSASDCASFQQAQTCNSQKD